MVVVGGCGGVDLIQGSFSVVTVMPRGAWPATEQISVNPIGQTGRTQTARTATGEATSGPSAADNTRFRCGGLWDFINSVSSCVWALAFYCGPLSGFGCLRR